MILVTVGNHTQPFDRLIIAMDELAKTIHERVIIQRGCSTYIPKRAEHFQWTTSQRMEELTEAARVVIGHSGSGTIITTLKNCKPMIVVPRLKRYGEHFDDHQIQLAEILGSNGRIIVVQDPSLQNLGEAIRNVTTQISNPINNSNDLINAIRRQLFIWDKK